MTPYHGQAKPIERAWNDLAEEVSKHPAMSGCYTGNTIDAKPENYMQSAVPLDKLQAHVAEIIAEHNARTGRRTETAKGKSFDQVFAESMAAPSTIVRQATEPADEHFDGMSAGDIVRQLAERHGYDAKVSESFDQAAIPYIARTNQSTADFLTRLARRTGAQFSIKDGKFLFLEPGILAPITIDKSECAEWSFSIEPRPTYGKTKAGWYNRDTGIVETTTTETGLEGPSKTLRTTYASRQEAEAAARSEANRQAAKTGSGSITMAGRTDILAGATINASGFRREAAGLWYAKSVRHQFANGYTIQISLEATREGKKA